uniref:Uncharacterized protein n=1 Tax=Romanomermis culicivorax TaxID=13658 RepID=A0A915K0D7_ROMCU
MALNDGRWAALLAFDELPLLRDSWQGTKNNEKLNFLISGSDNVIQSFSSRTKFKNHIENVQAKFKNQATNDESEFFKNFCYCPLLVKSVDVLHAGSEIAIESKMTTGAGRHQKDEV